ncbi:hypothetical protein FQA39_LY05399 [Lamprigera yunnana]|nr:hypothetical protein FQA39_LY05399 [Lamprigera yunnana]
MDNSSVVIQITENDEPSLNNVHNDNEKVTSRYTNSIQRYDHPNVYAFNSTSYRQQQVVGAQPVYVESSRIAPDYARDREDFDHTWFSYMDVFDDQIQRRRFITKVYLILTIQLIFTFGFTCICIFQEDANEFIKRTSNIGWVIALVVAFAIYFIFLCCEDSTRRSPLNYLLLVVMTLVFTYFTVLLSISIPKEIVFLSVGLTSCLCFSISLFASQTKIDFTKHLQLLLLLTLYILIYMPLLWIINIFWFHIEQMYLIWAYVITILFSFYLLMDTQMIMGGRRYELSPDEHVHAALVLYIDIILILWQIMRILSTRN